MDTQVISMIVLSVDLGWRNLSYVILEVFLESYKILEWENVDIMGEENININTTSLEDLVKNTHAKVKDIIMKWCSYKPEIAFLEQQPLGQMARNVKTKTMSHIMQSHLLSNSITVEFVNPKKKLKGLKNGETYQDNKKFAVEKTKSLLENNLVWLEKFMTHKKKDDLADSFLQGLYSAKEKFLPPKDKKPRTKKQKRDSHENTRQTLIINLDDEL